MAENVLEDPEQRALGMDAITDLMWCWSGVTNRLLEMGGPDVMDTAFASAKQWAETLPASQRQAAMARALANANGLVTDLFQPAYAADMRKLRIARGH